MVWTFTISNVVGDLAKGRAQAEPWLSTLSLDRKIKLKCQSICFLVYLVQAIHLNLRPVKGRLAIRRIVSEFRSFHCYLAITDRPIKHKRILAASILCPLVIVIVVEIKAGSYLAVWVDLSEVGVVSGRRSDVVYLWSYLRILVYVVYAVIKLGICHAWNCCKLDSCY